MNTPRTQLLAAVLALAAGLTLVAAGQPGKPTSPPKPGDKPADKSPAKPAPLAVLDNAAIFEGEPALVAEGLSFVEGPCWIKTSSGGFFAFCSLKGEGGTVYKLADQPDAKPEVWFSPSGRAIGLTVDRLGRLYLAEVESRSIVRRTADGEGQDWSRRVLAEKADEGKRLNATNDLVIGPDGAVYFTDPTFFTKKEDLELGYNAVWRVTPDGNLTLGAKMKLPNGLAFSPDGKTLYVSEFGEGKILAFSVAQDGSLGPPKEFADLKALATQHKFPTGGGADGLRVDQDGRVFATGPAGIWVIAPDGTALARLATSATNLAFGGPDAKTLLITGGGGKILKVGTKNPGWTNKPAETPPTKPATPK